MPLFVRAVVVGASAIGMAVLVAVAAAVLDLYLTGHGHGSIAREIITWRPAGVHLSAADLLLLTAVGMAIFISWRLTDRRARSDRGNDK